jgi:predicted GIY-YIG superfamily endonuclease
MSWLDDTTDVGAPGEPGDAGTVYLIHFDEPYRHARHYTGWTRNLDARLEAHREGYGARLMEVIRDAGITWRLARTWPGTRDRERAIKARHNAPRLCPQCTPNPQPLTAGRSAFIADPGSQAAVGQVRGQPSSAASDPPPGPGRGAESGSVWPGIPDEAAIRNRYRDLWEVTDNLISGWQQARARDAELGGAKAEVG